ncbi:MAG: hypothetical protein JXR13_09185 [Thalassovita sp.]
MDVGQIFDWVLIAFLCGSGLHKILGKERQAVEALHLNHRWGFAIGGLQIISIPFVFMQVYLPPMIMICVPFVIVAVLSAKYTKVLHSVVVLSISALIVARWASLGMVV